MKSVARASLVLVVGVATTLLLAGCLNNTGTLATNSPSAPPSSTAPTSTSTPTALPTPVTIKCSAVLTAQQVYDFNPNYVADSSYSPASGTDAAQVVADGGVACGWVDETSGSELVVAIAEPAASDLATLKSTASSAAAPVTVTANATGYFSSANGVGEFQVFTSAYWIVISSAEFSAATDAQPTASAVLGHLAAQ